MKQLLDTVPNHMGIEQGNALWEDVLENGPPPSTPTSSTSSGIQ
jgi:maltooligosyltrehalose synthase